MERRAEGERGREWERERWMEQMTKREVYHILPSDVRLTCTHTYMWSWGAVGAREGPWVGQHLVWCCG